MARRCSHPPPLWGRIQVGGEPGRSPLSQPSPARGEGVQMPVQCLFARNLAPMPLWPSSATGYPTVHADSIPRFDAGVSWSGAYQPSAGVEEPERLQAGPVHVGATPDEIFIDTAEGLNYSPASLRWLCCFRLLHQPRIVLIAAGPSDQKAEPVSPQQRRSPPMRQTLMIPSSTPPLMPRRPTPTRFLVRPQLLTRV